VERSETLGTRLKNGCALKARDKAAATCRSDAPSVRDAWGGESG
jgi:hypothetical protein